MYRTTTDPVSVERVRLILQINEVGYREFTPTMVLIVTWLNGEALATGLEVSMYFLLWCMLARTITMGQLYALGLNLLLKPVS